VRQLPGKLDRQVERAFLEELRMAFDMERPAIVIDCGLWHEMNSSAIHLLLCCLEEAMRRNGDVRLAAVSDEALENLRAMDVDRLFRIFDTTEKAIESFRRRAVYSMPDVATLAEHAA
jgi:anti-anti-sigma factor